MSIFDAALSQLVVLRSYLGYTAQKMASTHFNDRCKEIPTEIREKLLTLKHAAKSSDGGGKRYWSEAADLLGLVETESEGLKLKKGK